MGIVAWEFVTLDGVMEAPETWQLSTGLFDEAMGKAAFDLLIGTDALLLGRVTYELFAEAWPSMTDEDGFADRMNGLPKLVASTTLQEPLSWANSTLIEGDVAEELARLTQEPGQRISLVGSGTLLNALMQHDLIDEYQIWVHPIVIGSGKRLFADGAHTPVLELVGTKSFRTGVVALTYRPRGAEGAGTSGALDR
jgi:dihydrofolate reductase